MKQEQTVSSPLILTPQELADVAGRLRSAPIQSDPFPHIVVADLLPADFFQSLITAMPSLRSFSGSQRRADVTDQKVTSQVAATMTEYSQRFAASFRQLQERPFRTALRRSISTITSGRPRWRPKFDMDIAEDSAKSLFSEADEGFQQQWRYLRDVVVPTAVLEAVAEKFADHILEKYVHLFGEGPANDLLKSPFRSNKGRIMCRTPGYILRPHTDSAQLTVTCLLYLNSASDDSGAGLTLFRPNRTPELRHVGTYYPDIEGIESTEVKRLPLTANQFVAFINGRRSVHGVSIDRHKTGPRFERYAYQFHLVPSGKGLRSVVDNLAPDRKARWMSIRKEEDGAMTREPEVSVPLH